MSAKIDSDLLARVRIASPCAARWADMQGDDRARFCQQCQKHVYNLSAMTSADAAALVQARGGQICGRFYQRADGTMLTEDCPVGVARHWRRARAFAGAAIATLVMTFASIGMARQAELEGRGRERSRMAQARDEAIERVKTWLGLSKPPAMGGISLPPLPLPANFVMGEVCVAPPQAAGQTNIFMGKLAVTPPATNQPAGLEHTGRVQVLPAIPVK